MKKGFDALMNETYDYDIDISNRVDASFDDQNKLAVLKAFYKCQQLVYQGMLKEISDKHPLLSKIDTRIACLKKANRLALSSIKKELVALAEKPNLNALAFYLSVEYKKNWSEKIRKLVSEIERKSMKTPEEWEVVAFSHIQDKIQLSSALERTTTDIESVGINAIFEYDNYLEAFEKNSNTWREFWLKCRLYHSTFLDTEYGRALQKAQLGYYARFFVGGGKTADLDDYLRASQGINAAAVPKSVLEEYSGTFFSRENIARFLCKEYKAQKDKNDDEKYRYACALLTTSKNADKRAGLKLLEEVAQQKKVAYQKAPTAKSGKIFEGGLQK